MRNLEFWIESRKFVGKKKDNIIIIDLVFG